MLAFLARREQPGRTASSRQAPARGKTPEEGLLALFDVFDEWFRAADFEACSFINVLLAKEAGLRDVESFARFWHILMKGSIISATEGDAEAAKRAQKRAAVLIDEHR